MKQMGKNKRIIDILKKLDVLYFGDDKLDAYLKGLGRQYKAYYRFSIGGDCKRNQNGGNSYLCVVVDMNNTYTGFLGGNVNYDALYACLQMYDVLDGE